MYSDLHFSPSHFTLCDVSGETATSWKLGEADGDFAWLYQRKYLLSGWDGLFLVSPSNSKIWTEGEEVQGREEKKTEIYQCLISKCCWGKGNPNIVIWKSKRPRCFIHLDISTLPVKYYHQEKAWMTGKILHSYSTTFSAKMKAKKPSILVIYGQCWLPSTW